MARRRRVTSGWSRDKPRFFHDARRHGHVEGLCSEIGTFRLQPGVCFGKKHELYQQSVPIVEQNTADRTVMSDLLKFEGDRTTGLVRERLA